MTPDAACRSRALTWARCCRRSSAACSAARAEPPSPARPLTMPGTGVGRYARVAMADIHITDIEARHQLVAPAQPRPTASSLRRTVRALAEVLRPAVYFRETSHDEAPPAAGPRGLAGLVRHSTPDAPCIAICSTAQGDAVQGLRAHLRGGPALAGDDAGREARHLAPHRRRGQRLALQTAMPTGRRSVAQRSSDPAA